MPHQTSAEEIDPPRSNAADSASTLNAPNDYQGRQAGHGDEAAGRGGKRPTATVAQVLGPGPFISEDEADRLYERRIEDEYAKREGGA